MTDRPALILVLILADTDGLGVADLGEELRGTASAQDRAVIDARGLEEKLRGRRGERR